MADIEPPSFSLGLDLDPEPFSPGSSRQPQNQPGLNPDPNLNCSSVSPDDDGDEEEEECGFGLEVMDSEDEESGGEELGSHVTDPDQGPNVPPRVLKRLRRGLPKGVCCDDGDDEIEDFSSQDDFFRDAHPSTQHNPVCSSSKVPLRGSGVLTTQSSVRQKERKREPALDPPASSSLERGHNGLIFPKLTISPLRRFRLIDSDSESEQPPICEDANAKSVKVDSFALEQHSIAGAQKRKSPVEKDLNKDLWEDFCPVKSFNVPTPVLDEVCEEYFQSLRNKNVAQRQESEGIDHQKHANRIVGFEPSWSSADPLAHRYFFHNDPRIQKLVRSRLPNYSPMSIAKRANKQPSEPVIDYISQINGGANKKKGTQRGNSEKGSTRRRKSTTSNAKEGSSGSQGWVDPKSTATTPKDAGKRRVHANGQSAGRWFTSPEGRKVYVSRSGQELTGQMAYRNYRKENGGLRKSKKRTNAKRKKG